MKALKLKIKQCSRCATKVINQDECVICNSSELTDEVTESGTTYFDQDVARQYLRDGKKISHYYFSDTEFIHNSVRGVVTEEGYQVDVYEFFKDRSGGSWDGKWKLYE